MMKKTTTAATPLTAEDKLKGFKDLLRHRRKAELGVLKKFKDDLDDNPAFAMEWSLSSFTAAAKLHVIKQVLVPLEAEGSTKTLEDVHRIAVNQLTRLAKNPKRSSSPTDNLLHQEIAAEWAEIVEMTGSLLGMVF